MAIILVSGPPAAGKTTLATALALELGIASIAKDSIKEALADILGVRDQDWHHRLTAASFSVMWRLAATMKAVILDANFPVESAREQVRRLQYQHGRHVVEIFCECPLELCQRRFAERPFRHVIHPPEVLAMELLETYAEPIGLQHTLRVDTSQPFDIGLVLRWLAGVGATR